MKLKKRLPGEETLRRKGGRRGKTYTRHIKRKREVKVWGGGGGREKPRL